MYSLSRFGIILLLTSNNIMHITTRDLTWPFQVMRYSLQQSSAYYPMPNRLLARLFALSRCCLLRPDMRQSHVAAILADLTGALTFSVISLASERTTFCRRCSSMRLIRGRSDTNCVCSMAWAYEILSSSGYSAYELII